MIHPSGLRLADDISAKQAVGRTSRSLEGCMKYLKELVISKLSCCRYRPGALISQALLVTDIIPPSPRKVKLFLHLFLHHQYRLCVQFLENVLQGDELLLVDGCYSSIIINVGSVCLLALRCFVQEVLQILLV